MAFITICDVLGLTTVAGKTSSFTTNPRFYHCSQTETMNVNTPQGGANRSKIIKENLSAL